MCETSFSCRRSSYCCCCRVPLFAIHFVQSSSRQDPRNMFAGDLVEAPEPVEGEVEKEDKDRVRYNYGIVIHSDISDDKIRKEMIEICQMACEKFAAPEKSPTERDNEAAAEMIKLALDAKMAGPFNVIVGEAYSIEIDHIQQTLFYMYFGGYLAILVWKCV